MWQQSERVKLLGYLEKLAKDPLQPLNTSIDKSLTGFHESSVWTKLLIVATLVMLIALVINYARSVNRYKVMEGFGGDLCSRMGCVESFDVKTTPIAIYDKFYATVYDAVGFTRQRIDGELKEIVDIMRERDGGSIDQRRTRVLNIGSGSGHYVGALTNMGIDTVGIDIAPAMVETARENYPKAKFEVGDAIDTMRFGVESFSDIMMMYMTIYYVRDKHKLLENCYYWLKPTGFLYLHLVDADKYDPSRDHASPLDINNYSPDKAHTEVAKLFMDVEYRPSFADGVFREQFKNRATGYTRVNEHKYYMERQSDILAIAKDCGFILYSMETIMDNEYMYVLMKPE